MSKALVSRVWPDVEVCVGKKSAKDKLAGPIKPPSKDKNKAARGKSGAGGLKKIIAPTETDYLLGREEGAEKEDSRYIVAFHLDGDLYAVDVAYVRAVIMAREVAQLPHTPGFIEGLVSVRGEMILVMNLMRRLGIESAVKAGGNILITESFDHEIGIIVNKMAGVMEVPMKLKPFLRQGKGKSKGLAGEDRRFFKGIARAGDKVVRVLDIEKLMDFELPPEAV